MSLLCVYDFCFISLNSLANVVTNGRWPHSHTFCIVLNVSFDKRCRGSWRRLYSLCASILHALTRWVTLSTFSLHNRHLLISHRVCVQCLILGCYQETLSPSSGQFHEISVFISSVSLLNWPCNFISWISFLKLFFTFYLVTHQFPFLCHMLQ